MALFLIGKNLIKVVNKTATNSRFTQLRSFYLPENLFSRRMFYLGRENSVRFHSQLREAATRWAQAFAKSINLDHEKISFFNHFDLPKSIFEGSRF